MDLKQTKKVSDKASHHKFSNFEESKQIFVLRFDGTKLTVQSQNLTASHEAGQFQQQTTGRHGLAETIDFPQCSDRM